VPRNLGVGINSRHNENYISVTADFSYVYFESYPEGAEDKDIYRAPLPRQFHPESLAPTNNKDQDIQANVKTNEAVSPLSSTVHSIGDLEALQYFKDGQVNTRILNNSYFPYNSYSISPESRTKLNEIARLLLDHPAMQVQLKGHADSWGTDKANLRISYLRAQAAAHFLIDQGVSNNRLLVIGAAAEVPMASNDDEKEGRELNRRVEVTLMSPAGTSDL
jgi:outer membrane protein OmpA-like peptidoglycan-associated protein